MSKKSPRQHTVSLVKELFKHARRDDCYNCKKLLEAMGLNPDLTFNENFRVREEDKPQ